MTPDFVREILASPYLEPLARILLTFPFWISALQKIFFFKQQRGEFEFFGLKPGAAYLIPVGVVQAVASIMIVAGIQVWLAAAALSLLILLTIPVANRFWAYPPPRNLSAYYAATEHVGIVGAMILVAILAAPTDAAPESVRALLAHPVTPTVASVLLTCAFWSAAIQKLIRTKGDIADFEFFGVKPAIPYLIVVFIVQVVGTFLIISGTHVWFGAGMLAVFTLVTIPVVHHFWALPAPINLYAWYATAEHAGTIGGFILVSIVAARMA